MKIKNEIKTFFSLMLIVLCSVELVQGSCLSFGHSCWGAHGKRSNSAGGMLRPQQTPTSLEQRWALLKILPDDKNDIYNTMKKNLRINYPDMIDSDERKPIFGNFRLSSQPFLPSQMDDEDLIQREDGKKIAIAHNGLQVPNPALSLQQQPQQHQPQFQQHKFQAMKQLPDLIQSNGSNDDDDLINNTEDDFDDELLDSRNLRLFKMMNQSPPSAKQLF